MENNNTTTEEMEQAQGGAYSYTYRALSPEQRKSAERILAEYEPKAQTPLTNFARLQKLQNRITKTLVVFGLTMGIVGCLVFGGGLSMVLLNANVLALQIAGGGLCAVGAAVMLATYPAYQGMRKRLKKKYGDEIVRLCKDVLDEESSQK